MIKPLLRLLLLISVVLICAGAFNNLQAFSDGNNYGKANYKQQGPEITASGSLNLCPGGSVTLTANDFPAGAALQWFKNDLAISNATQSTYVAREAGNFSVVASLGGIDTNYPAVTVTVNTNPVANFTYANTNACNTSVSKFTNSSSGGNNLTYVWDFGDPNSGSNNISTETNPVHKFIGTTAGSSQTFTVRLTVTTEAGCSNSYSININKPVNGTLLGGTNSILYDGKRFFRGCGNTALEFTFTNQSSTVATNTSYKIIWGDGSADFSGASFSALKHTYSVGTYQLRYIVNQAACIDTADYYVFVGSNPAVGLGNPGNTVICTGSALTFPVTLTENNPPGTIYTVTYNDGTPATTYTSAPQTVTHTFQNSSCGVSSGNYTNSFLATIVASNPCNSSTATISPIYVSQKPKAQFTISPSEITCTGNTVTFTNTSQGNTVSNGTCNSGKVVWSISPTTGYTLINSSSLGSDYGQDDASLWLSGSTYLYLRFTTPGTYTIKLRTGGSNCGNDVITKTICVTAPPIASFTVDNLTGCSPLAVKITNTTPASTCGTNTYRWTISPTTGVTYTNNTTAISTNPEFNFAAAGNYTLSLVATSPGGGCTSNTATQTITVKAKPTFTLNAAASICAGSSITPTATITAGTGLTYAWIFEGGTPATSVLANPGVITYATAGNYTTPLTLTNDCGSTTLTNLIAVKEVPTVTIPPDLSFCAGAASGNIIFASTSTGTITYSWRSDNTAIGIAANGTGNINSFTTRNISLTPITANITVTPINNGCTGTPVSFKITINPKPAAPTVTSPQTYCVNDAATALTATAATGNILTWYSNAALTTKLPEAPTPATTTAGTTTFYVTQTNAFGCESAVASITINVNPAINNNVVAADQTICYNNVPAQLRGVGAISGGNGTYTFQWQLSADGMVWTNISGATGATYSPPALTASAQFRRVASSGGCSLTSNQVSITVQGLLTNYNIGSSQTICNNSTPILLTGQLPTGGNGVFVYQWQSSVNNISWTNITDATSQDYQPKALTATTYFRRLTTSGICSGYSSVVIITVNQNSKAEFTATNTTGCIPFDLSKVIKPVLHDDVNGSYEWFANGVSIGKTAAFPGYILKNDGENISIKLITTSKFGCNSSELELNFNTVKTVSASFTKDQTKGCGPITAHFVNTSQPLNAGTYLWDFGNGQTSTQIQPNDITFLQHPQNRDTTYKITLAVTTACGTTFYVDSVHVRPKPKAVFTPDKTIGCSPFEITLTNQSAGLPNTYTYYFGNGEKQVLTDNQTIKYTYTTTKTDTLTLKLVAENECGKDSSFYKIVVYPNNVQAKLVVNGDNQFGCSPITVNFYNNSTGANTFNWDFADGNTAITTKSPDVIVHTFTKPGVYNVKLTASNGCSTASTNQIITVYEQPLAAFTLQKLQYCVRDSVEFANTSTQGNFAYRWDFGDGSFSNDTNPKHPYAKPGTYIITLTLTQSYANGSACTNTVSHTTEVLAAPNAAFLSNAGTLNCAPFTLNVSAAPVNALSPVWSFGDAASGTANQAAGYTASHTFIKAGVYRVVLTTYNQNGCADSTSQLMRVTESPLAAFLPGDSVLCGTTATVNFINKTTYSGTVSYRWVINNALISTQKNLTYAFIPPANATFPYRYLVRLIASGISGCTDTITHQILLNGFPKAVFTVKNISGCAPFKAEILNTSLYADQFKWYLNNQLVSTDQTPQNIILTESAKSYQLKLVVSNALGCKADSLTTTISTFAKPIAAFSLKDSLSCNSRLDIQITNKTTGATSYTWNFGDGTSEVTTTTPLHTYGIPGTYYLRLIAYNGFCRDTIIHTVKIASPPQAAFTADNLKGCTQVTATFQNISTNATTYLWDFGDGTFSSGKNPTHTFSYLKSPYNIKLIAIGEYGCADTTVAANYIVVSAPPKADFTILPDSVIKIPDYTFNFSNKSTGNPISIKWDFGDGKTATTDNPTHTYLDTGTYKVKLTVVNANNCTNILTRTVKITGVPGYLFVPNAFEPGSGKNELKTFAVRASGLSAYTLRIFNKWGEMVWESNKLDVNGSPTEGWDGLMHGQPAPQGVYVWYISAKFINGTEWKGMKYETGGSTKTGPIHLIR